MQGKFTDLTGQRFGRLLVRERGPTDGKGAQWWCQCDCGKAKLAKARRLIQGNTRSCGCLLRESNQRRFEAPESRERLAEAMRRSWENGGRRTAELARMAGRPPKAPKPATTTARPRFRKEASLDLAKALGLARRK